MGIYIPNMEMPKTCCQCDLKIYDPEKRWNENGIEQIGAWVCKRTREIIWNTQRGENCPIFPLPEGHGDFCKEEGGDPVSKLYTVWLLPGEYATLMQALDTAIEHCAEYDITSLELAVIHLKESIKASTDFDNP